MKTKSFELPISTDYVPDWGVFECLREILQNARDEAELSGREATFKWSAGYLHIDNPGAILKRNALLLGKSTKRGTSARGKHGEGLDLAFLAGVRAGLKITLTTYDEEWIPRIAPSKTYGEDVLWVRIRESKNWYEGVRVSIKIKKRGWKEFKKKFLFCLTDAELGEYMGTASGLLLCSPEFKGCVYVKGIFVMKDEKLQYGYDLFNADLDRDRRMISRWEMEYEVGQVLNAAVDKDAGSAKLLYDAMIAEAPDTSRFATDNTTAGVVAQEAMADIFRQEHGQQAVPVESAADIDKLAHYGLKGVVVPTSLRKTLEKHINVTDAVAKMTEEGKGRFSWNDLEETELENLMFACEKLEPLAMRNLLDRIHITQFQDDAVLGAVKRGSDEIRISRKVLGDKVETLSVLVHEEAHVLMSAGDGTKGHVAMIEHIWSQIYKAEIEGTN